MLANLGRYIQSKLSYSEENVTWPLRSTLANILSSASACLLLFTSAHSAEKEYLNCY